MVDGPVSEAYALLVGSNRPGSGQKPLGYAEADAERMAALLVDLGRHDPARVVVLKSPGRRELLAALDDLAARITHASAEGTQTQLFFYYSGHARAQGLSLGNDQLDLSELRDRIEAIPTTLTLVVLDACQSGAFSAVKGAEPAAEFSFNSVSRLMTSGIAVVASSTASELSQESAELGSSYFTHHWLVGLRGAADANHDGRVALDEAYQYAYNATLAATAGTALGTQHATIEKELRGKGEIALTYPAAASTHLALISRLAGSLVIQSQSAGVVVAEIEKAAGAPMLLAMPPGAYVAMHRQGDTIERCPLELVANTVNILDRSLCRRVEAPMGRRKLGPVPDDPMAGIPLYAVEIGAGGAGGIADTYTKRLRDFGFEHDARATHLVYRLAFLRRLTPELTIGARLEGLGGGSAKRPTAEGVEAAGNQEFAWSAWDASLHVRIMPAFELVVPYLQLGVGIGLGRTQFRDSHAADEVEYFAGYAFSTAAGVSFAPWKHAAFFAEATYTRAPIIKNLLGDTHDSGGFGIVAGARAMFWERH